LVVVPPGLGGVVGRPRSALRVLWRVENGVRHRLITGANAHFPSRQITRAAHAKAPDHTAKPRRPIRVQAKKRRVSLRSWSLSGVIFFFEKAVRLYALQGGKQTNRSLRISKFIIKVYADYLKSIALLNCRLLMCYRRYAFKVTLSGCLYNPILLYKQPLF